VLKFYLEKSLPEGTLMAQHIDSTFDALGDQDRLASLLGSMDSETLEHTNERL
jgi:hypothetical protein